MKHLTIPLLASLLAATLALPAYPQAYSTPSPQMRVYQEGELSVDDMVRLLTPEDDGLGQGKGYQLNGKGVSIAQEDLDNCFKRVQTEMPEVGVSKNFNEPLQATEQQIPLALKYGEGQHTLSANARQEVAKLAAALKKMAPQDRKHTAPRLVIEGHANATGSPALNKNLTCLRAAHVREVLRTQHHIDTRYIQAVGYGDTQTLPHLPPTDAANRRVVIRGLRP